ncbi:GSU2403 family nucleotidyltransferase fold protein [Cupriavidus sp. UYPR2.512]|uniref:GSU2403 family nucleotidyltransferase fold protein n=1 Tax=Cupriavidus sp. UYPR2.512 TaxID=1080187 RepID=UPI00038230F8|nr:GSU2403 family nucleotidyltransferase fold protein [Cupriavidus sp. UYPR2.512]UIF89270.1 hypothetical protein KAF44_30300 [Cupriavidus necator]
MSELVEFSTLAATLEPWRHQVVFIGGWAYRLYRYEPRAYKPDYEAIFTQDADVAYAKQEALEGDIKKALEGAGFSEEANLSGGFKPPAMRYTFGEDGFYAEFLTPLTGSPRRRNKVTGEFEPDATEANGGVVAQKLRHLEVLLHEPWMVTIPAEDSGLGESVVDLRIPNPVSFIVQKLLIRDDRVARKRAQDVLYVHDTLYIFSGAIESDLCPIWRTLEAALTEAQRKSVRAGITELFSEVKDVIRDAATIPSDRKLEPEDMLKLCQYGIGELFR